MKTSQLCAPLALCAAARAQSASLNASIVTTTAYVTKPGATPLPPIAGASFPGGLVPFDYDPQKLDDDFAGKDYVDLPPVDWNTTVAVADNTADGTFDTLLSVTFAKGDGPPSAGEAPIKAGNSTWAVCALIIPDLLENLNPAKAPGNGSCIDVVKPRCLTVAKSAQHAFIDELGYLFEPEGADLRKACESITETLVSPKCFEDTDGFINTTDSDFGTIPVYSKFNPASGEVMFRGRDAYKGIGVKDTKDDIQKRAMNRSWTVMFAQISYNETGVSPHSYSVVDCPHAGLNTLDIKTRKASDDGDTGDKKGDKGDEDSAAAGWEALLSVPLALVALVMVLP